MERVAIFGAGGHAKVIFDILLKSDHQQPVLFFAKKAEEHKVFGLSVMAESDFQNVQDLYDSIIVAIGDNWVRSKVVKSIVEAEPNARFATAIHPSAEIGQNVAVLPGTAVMAQTAINSSARIGPHCIVNTGAVVEHDVSLGGFSSLGPNACMGGDSHIGEYTAVSLGATILHGQSVGSHTVVGAGSVVTQNMEDQVLCLGVPSKVARTRDIGERYL